MTLVSPGGPVETAPPHAALIRFFNRFLWSDGVSADTDFPVTGSNTASSVVVGGGAGFVLLQGDAVRSMYPVRGTETRTITAPPVSGVRRDMLGIQVWSQEHGDDHDAWDLVVVAGSVGSSVDPVPSPVTAGWLPLHRILVPAGSALASRYTFQRVVPTIAPTRQGGFTDADLNISPATITEHHRSIVSDGGYVTRTFQTALDFTPATVLLIGTSPISGTPDAPSSFLLDRTQLTSTGFKCRVLRGDGTVITSGAFIEFDVVIVRN